MISRPKFLSLPLEVICIVSLVKKGSSESSTLHSGSIVDGSSDIVDIDGIILSCNFAAAAAAGKGVLLLSIDCEFCSCCCSEGRFVVVGVGFCIICRCCLSFLDSLSVDV